jgi:hypothetical protein
VAGGAAAAGILRRSLRHTAAARQWRRGKHSDLGKIGAVYFLSLKVGALAAGGGWVLAAAAAAVEARGAGVTDCITYKRGFGWRCYTIT